MISVVADKELLPWNHHARHSFWKVHHVDLRVKINSYTHLRSMGFSLTLVEVNQVQMVIGAFCGTNDSPMKLMLEAFHPRALARP